MIRIITILKSTLILNVNALEINVISDQSLISKWEKNKNMSCSQIRTDLLE